MKIPFKINQREKKVLLFGGIVAIIIIVYQIFLWYGGIRTSLKDYTEARRITLEKQYQKIVDEEFIEGQYNDLNNNLNNLDKGLLKGSKTPVVAARIQSILKGMASSLDIAITLEKALDPVDKGFYLAIPVEVGFTSSTEKLTRMLYKIKTSSFNLTITEMKILVKNIRNPVNAYTTIVVNGFIKRPETDKKETKKG
jgi:Tfp pilus assembly protein PilO